MLRYLQWLRFLLSFHALTIPFDTFIYICIVFETEFYLFQELREAFEQESSATGLPRLLLTCAVGAPPIIARDAYDIETMYR